MPECGIDGTAQILSISPCPPIRAGPGQIVTGTFHHQSAAILDLHISGLSAPIGTTANHPFWSQTRTDFVRADELQPGERLRTVEGTAELLAIVPRATRAPVYNLEVQHTHIYHVATNGVLVHNGSKQTCKTLAQGGSYSKVRNAKRSPGRRGEVHHMPADSTTDLTLTHGKGPAIWMSVADHKKTRSYGSSDNATAWQNRTREILKEPGGFKKAFEREVRSIRKDFGKKYDKGIKQAREYAKNAGFFD